MPTPVSTARTPEAVHAIIVLDDPLGASPEPPGGMAAGVAR